MTSLQHTHEQDNSTLTLSHREKLRDIYWSSKDPIVLDRLLWRAQTFRHLVHLLPGQSICELGCGEGTFTKQLLKISRNENPITAVTFQPDLPVLEKTHSSIKFLSVKNIAKDLSGNTYDYVVSMDLLDQRNCAFFLEQVYTLLKPGGQILFYETNPLNVFLQVKEFFKRLIRKGDWRHLINRSKIHTMVSQAGFVKTFTAYNDFVYAPLTPGGVWLLRNLSILLENVPFIKTSAGSVLVHAQKTQTEYVSQAVSLCDHEQLIGAVSVVVPCFNEEMNVTPLVKQLTNFYGKYIHEIILVDDNSSDATREVIKQLALDYKTVKPVFRLPPNGVGRALMEGYRQASGKYILSMDCDFQHLLPELRDLFDMATLGYDVVIGSRFSRHSVLLNYPFQKILANRVFHVIARLIFLKSLRDLTNNLKLTKREIIDDLELSQTGFAINAETGLHPLIKGYRVTEVPISWINRTAEMGTSSFKLLKVGRGYWKVLVKAWIGIILKNIEGKRSAFGKIKTNKL